MNRISELRRARAMTQKQLSAALGCAQNTLANYENENRALTPETLLRLCDIFDVSADYLLCRTAVPKSDFSPEEMELVAAYRRADTRAKDMVDLALEPFREQKQEGVS